jgi:3-oxoacyl-[acyl-carrier protein] reductase
MDLGIEGRKAIVCASSRGLGKGCALALAQAGVDLVINGRDAATLERTAQEIRRATGASVTPVVADVATHEGQRALLAACPAPDILINNNGGPPHRDFRELDRDAIFRGLTMNMVSAIELIQKVLDPMAARGFGRIVNITSISVRMPVAGLDLSSGARAGLTAFVAGVARSVADRNVTINNILPGYFDTDRMRSGFAADAQRTGSSEDAVATQRAALIPAKRFGSPDEFGQTCAFLCSQHAGYITGQSILLDGGLYRSTL